MAAFSLEIPVRFGDTDPAGIVFYPRYFEMISRLIEDWFARGLRHDFRRLHMVDGRGIPTVELTAAFSNPSRLGDVLSFALTVERIGNKSVTLNVRATCDGEERLRSRQTVVYASTGDTVRAEPLPDDLRAAMANFLAPG